MSLTSIVVCESMVLVSTCQAVVMKYAKMCVNSEFASFCVTRQRNAKFYRELQGIVKNTVYQS